MEEYLDTVYFTDSERYIEYLAKVKDSGWKVYRSSAGKHILKNNTDWLKQAFGGIFKDFF